MRIGDKNLKITWPSRKRSESTAKIRRSSIVSAQHIPVLPAGLSDSGTESFLNMVSLRGDNLLRLPTNMTDEISIEQNVAGHPVVFPYSEPISLGPISLELRVDPSGDIVLPMDPSFSWRVLATNTVKRPTAEAYFAEHPDDPLGMATPAAVVRGDGIYLPKEGLAELHIPPADDLVLRVSHNAALFQFIQRTAHRGADSSRIGGSIDVPPADPEYYRAHGVLLPPAIVDEETLEEIL